MSSSQDTESIPEADAESFHFSLDEPAHDSDPHATHDTVQTRSTSTSIQSSIQKAREYLTPVKELSLPSVPVHHTNTGCLKFLPAQVNKRHAHQPLRFNFAVVGQSGLGKSTFINMLLYSAPCARTMVKGHTDYTAKTTQLDIRHYAVEENGFKADFTAIDTIGYGKYIDNRNCWVPLTNYIDKQHMLYMFQDEQPNRSKICDSRVNACIYFIAPTGKPLGPIDIEAMKELSLRVNLIPVIAKADSMTRTEVHEFKVLLKHQLLENEIKVYQNCSPFALICSEQRLAINGSTCFARSYPYGIVNCEDSNNNDFVALRGLLMSHSTLELIESAHNVYYHYQRLVLMLYRRQKVLETTQDIPDSSSNHLDLLRAIQTVKLQDISKEHLEKDPLFLQQVATIRARYNEVGDYQCQRFSQIQKSLHSKRLDGEMELKQVRYDINDLRERINAIKSKRR